MIFWQTRDQYSITFHKIPIMKILPALLLLLLPLTSFSQKYFKGFKRKIKIIHSNGPLIKSHAGEYMIRGKVSFEVKGFDTINCDSVVWNRKTRKLKAFGAHKFISKEDLPFTCVSPVLYIFFWKKKLIVGCEARWSVAFLLIYSIMHLTKAWKVLTLLYHFFLLSSPSPALRRNNLKALKIR